MSSDVLIGPARPDDLAAVLRLLERTSLPTAGLADHLAHAIVARQDDEIVASAALEIYGDGALLRSVAVDPRLQGTGLGQRITSAAIAAADAEGVPALFLLTTTANGFFPKFGFSVVSRADVPDTVRDSVEFRSACPASAVVMQKTLRRSIAG
jgi:amino-acid N-acetyltransferase